MALHSGSGRRSPARDRGCDESQPGKPCVCPGGSHALSVAGGAGARESGCRGPAAGVRRCREPCTHRAWERRRTRAAQRRAAALLQTPRVSDLKWPHYARPTTKEPGPLTARDSQHTSASPNAAAADAVTMTRPARPGKVKGLTPRVSTVGLPAALANGPVPVSFPARGAGTRPCSTPSCGLSLLGLCAGKGTPCGTPRPLPGPTRPAQTSPLVPGPGRCSWKEAGSHSVSLTTEGQASRLGLLRHQPAVGGACTQGHPLL